ncbi:MAG: c-type cytochrome [Burkholderiales bacterium]|nr:c-type cytochrome [Burkholderiales bacterium]
MPVHPPDSTAHPPVDLPDPARWQATAAPVTRRRPGWSTATLGLLCLLGPLAAAAQATSTGMAPPAASPAAATGVTAPAAGASATLPATRRGASIDPATPNAQGALLYHNYCSVCHGDRGDGRSRATGALSTPPRDFTSALSRQELTHERIVRAVTYGRPGTAMVGWTSQLSATDIERVADYVSTRFIHGSNTSTAQAGSATQRPGLPAGHPAPAGVTAGATAGTTAGAARFAGGGTPAISGTQAHGGREVDEPAPTAAPGNTGATTTAAAPPGRSRLAPVPASALDPKLPLPLGLVGKPQRGETYYRANCVACHGLKGDGQGPRAYFINPPPRNFIDPTTRARLNRPLLFAAIHAGRLGTEMPAWSKVASDQQIADVAEYVFRTFVLGGTAPGVAAKP